MVCRDFILPEGCANHVFFCPLFNFAKLILPYLSDLSLCFTEDLHHEKKSPNPNVMVELGYAVKTLGWERIICLCNTDYGNQYPFDIAHNRITGFSLEGKKSRAI